MNARVAVVTGGASGIGLAVAQRLARDGVRVAVTDLNGEAARAAAEKITAEGGTAAGIELDVGDRAAVERGFDEVRRQLGPVAILVNSAGKEGYRRFLNISVEAWEQLLRINLTGTFHCCQVAVPDMIEARWGRIVNISSSSALGGQPFMTHYVASKAGVIGLTKALALELGPEGITVNTIPPGFIDTPMLRRSEERGLLGDSVDHHASQTPVRRPGRPEDIAATAAFLVSDEAGYITGQVIAVSGGRNT
ncbi:SDR family NAD(P)-dependent oxidoreductase [Catenulispora rubra]|uniref:SDR family NAD(P)-dependent oxidoreductase n=1 Tax=Catenulispora rubra TaxID=280293 RepID=UPI0018927C23|nr:SDR family NAD(P)-dependent oxidoreductase [Catenulispora rubra]